MFHIIRRSPGTPIFLDGAGNPIEFGEGEAAGNDVLMDQQGSLVYFTIQVNDVYAYFLAENSQLPAAQQATQFPSSPSDMNKVIAFGRAHRKTFPDANAMTMEIKSAWVEASGLDVSKYVTMTATIPTYDTSSSTTWIKTGMTQTQLALVGIHVVGSLNGHPEMAWAPLLNTWIIHLKAPTPTSTPAARRQWCPQTPDHHPPRAGCSA